MSFFGRLFYTLLISNLLVASALCAENLEATQRAFRAMPSAQVGDFLRGLFKSDLFIEASQKEGHPCLLYTSPSPRDRTRSRMPSSA